MLDEKLSAAAFIAEIGEDANPFFKRNFHGIQNIFVRHDGIQFLAVCQHFKETNIIFIQTHGVLAEKEIDHAFIGRNHCGERHIPLHPQIQHRHQLFQTGRHIPVSPCDGKILPEIQLRRRFDGRGGKTAVFIDDLIYTSIIRLSRCKDTADKTEYCKGVHFQFSAQFIKRQRDPCIQCRFCPLRNQLQLFFRCHKGILFFCCRR